MLIRTRGAEGPRWLPRGRAHIPAHHLRPLTRFDPAFQEKAADLFDRVKSRIGDNAIDRTGSYSFHETLPRFATTPRTLAKIIIREDARGNGDYVLLRADGLLDPWLKHDPWTRIDPDPTLRIVSVPFYHFQLSDSDDLDGIADAITAIILNDPPP